MRQQFTVQGGWRRSGLSKGWRRSTCGLLAAGLLAGAAHAQAPVVTAVSPGRNAVAAPRSTAVRATFSQALSNSAATQGGLRVFSPQAGGRKAGTATVSGTTLTFTPSTAFKPGETVQASVTTAVQGATGVAAVPHVFQFTAATAAATGQFARTTLPFNASLNFAAGDIDGDGDLDLLTPDFYRGYVGVLLNAGSATFSIGTAILVNRGVKPVLGDLDGDGDLDVAVVGNGNSAVSVRLNSGQGNFSGSQEIGQEVYDAALGDVDADGDLDLLALSFNSNEVSLYRNNGQGSFDAGQSMAVTSGPFKLLTGDVDNDGDLDFVVCHPYSHLVSVHLNNGQGGFANGSEVSWPSNSFPYNAVLGDVDGDGDLDLLTSNTITNATTGNQENGTVSVRLNDGSGVFKGNQEVAAARSNDAINLSDVDGDGDLDLLILNEGISTIYLRLNNGTGTFASSGQDPAVGNYPTALVVGDFDGDGDVDLVTSDNNDGTLSLLLNQNKAVPMLTAAAPAAATIGSTITLTGTDLYTTTSISFNGTRATNFSIVSATQLTVVVPLGATTGPVVVTTSAGTSNGLPFAITPALIVTAVSPASGAVAAPRSTAVRATFSQALSNSAATQGGLRVFSPQAGGRKAGTATVSGTTLTFTPSTAFKPGETVQASVTTAVQSSSGQVLVRPQVVQFTTAAAAGPGLFTGGTDLANNAGAYRTVTGDIDGDGDLDLLTANNTSSTVSVSYNTGTGTFSSGPSVAIGTAPRAIVLGDFDGDGDLDFATANYNFSSSNTVSIGLNQGGGSFSVGTVVGFSSASYDVDTGDVDGDGDLDLLEVGVDGITILANTGTGSFYATQRPTVGRGPQSGTLGDLDGDGDLDLLTADYSNTSVSIRFNDGTGVFSGGSTLLFGGSPTHVALGDVDGDGDLDIAVVNYTVPGYVSVRFNNGIGGFALTPLTAAEQRVPVGEYPGRVALGDIDGDGDLDLLANNSNGNTVSVRLNNGAGLFAGNQEVVVGNRPYSVILGDLDGDNDLDLATANVGGSSVSVRFNQVALPPTLTSVTPAIGPVGSTVVITGANLNTVTSLTFNGTPATVISFSSPTQLTVTVPPGATSGPLVVTTPAGAASLPFVVSIRPTLTALLPARNAVAAPRPGPVTLTFDQPLASSAATLGALKVFSQRAGGRKAGTVTASGNTFTFSPTVAFKAGETVFATLTTALQSSTLGSPVRPLVYQFTAATSPSVPTFNNGSAVSVGADSRGIATGDIDGDGDLDLLAASYGSNAVSVRRNNGNGTFINSQEVAVGGQPSRVALGDIDGDGDLDLLAANTVPSSISLRRNDGAGNFDQGTELTLGGTAVSADVEVGDMDGDGDLDLVVRSGAMRVLFNDGQGNFSINQDATIDYLNGNLVVADLDNDGDLDLAGRGANRLGGPTIRVLLNNGAGSFTNGTTLNVGGINLTEGLVAGDVDGDGDLDLVRSGTSGPSLLLNNGTAGLTEAALAGASIIGAVALGDVDGDGDLDAVYAGNSSSNASSSVYVRLNNGAGVFTAGALELPIAGFYDVVLADVDGDNTLDILSSRDGTVSVRLNQSGLRVPENPAGAVAGLVYQYYEAADSYFRLPNFATSTPRTTGVVPNFDVVSPRLRDYAYALRFTGYVTVPASGQYTFYTRSDDGSQLFVGSTLVVDNDGQHDDRLEQAGTIGLRAGTHAFTVTYFQSGGGQSLAVSYQGPGVAKQLIPAASLRYLPASPAARALADSPAQAATTLQVYPNPNQGRFTVRCSVSQAQAAHLELLDPLGRRVRQQTVQLHAGDNQLPLEATGLAQGFYQLWLRPALDKPQQVKVSVAN